MRAAKSRRTDRGRPLEMRHSLAPVRDLHLLHEPGGDGNAGLIAAHSREHRMRKERADVDHRIARDPGGKDDLALADVVAHQTHPLSEVYTKRDVLQRAPVLVSAMIRMCE